MRSREVNGLNMANKRRAEKEARARKRTAAVLG